MSSGLLVFRDNCDADLIDENPKGHSQIRWSIPIADVWSANRGSIAAPFWADRRKRWALCAALPDALKVDPLQDLSTSTPDEWSEPQIHTAKITTPELGGPLAKGSGAPIKKVKPAKKATRTRKAAGKPAAERSNNKTRSLP